MHRDKSPMPLSRATARPWKGQSWPRSSTGCSLLVEPLPHHIACDARGFSYQRGWTTDRQARLLQDFTAG